jgi:hypothetical protein
MNSMRSLALGAFALAVSAGPAFAATTLPALAADPPYLKLAKALGTPHLAESIGPKDHSSLQLKFTPDGESADKFTKLTTISILKVEPTSADTESAARGVIVRLRDAVKSRRADVKTFDESPLPPVTLFYEFSGDGDTSKGIVYTPTYGFVAAIQLDVKNGGTIRSSDVATLKSVIGK